MTRDLVQGSRIVRAVQRGLARGRVWLERGRTWVAHRHAWQSVVRTARATPLRAGGWLLAAAVLANAAGLWGLGRTMTGVGMAQRALLLTIGLLAATGRPCDWSVVTGSSWFVRWWTPPAIKDP